MKTISANLTNMIKKFFKTEYVILALITFILVASAFIIFSITGQSLGMDDNAKLNEFYSPLEDEYVADVRAYLNGSGYTNPGVSLTHTTDEDLCRVYTLKIHHRRLEGLSSSDRSDLIRTLSEMGFADDRCTIRVSIIR